MKPILTYKFLAMSGIHVLSVSIVYINQDLFSNVVTGERNP
jgi:hypothetical protein